MPPARGQGPPGGVPAAKRRRADPPPAAAPAAAAAQWACSKCTLLNDEAKPNCDICGTPRLPAGGAAAPAAQQLGGGAAAVAQAARAAGAAGPAAAAAGPAAGAAVDPNLQKLMGMGITRETAKAALARASGDGDERVFDALNYCNL